MGGVKSYSAPPRGVAWEPSFARKRSQAERHPTFQDPLHPRGFGRLRFASISPSTHITKNSHDRPRERERRTLRLINNPPKSKVKFLSHSTILTLYAGLGTCS